MSWAGLGCACLNSQSSTLNFPLSAGSDRCRGMEVAGQEARQAMSIQLKLLQVRRGERGAGRRRGMLGLGLGLSIYVLACAVAVYAVSLS
jgi:hypothetical protein